MNRDDLRAKAEAARDAIAAHAALNEDEPAERRAYARMEDAVEAMREAVTPDVVLALFGVVDLAAGAPSNDAPHGILCEPFDPAALRAKALAATPGPWYRPGGYGAVRALPSGRPIGAVNLHKDAAYIAAIDPTTLLTLLSERDALVAERDSWQAHAERFGIEARDMMFRMLETEAALDLERGEHAIAVKRLDRIEKWLEGRGVPQIESPENVGNGTHGHIKERLERLVTQEQARGREQAEAERDALAARAAGLEAESAKWYRAGCDGIDAMAEKLSQAETRVHVLEHVLRAVLPDQAAAVVAYRPADLEVASLTAGQIRGMLAALAPAPPAPEGQK